MSTTLDLETALENEAYQRNQQTAADFPPGTFIRISGHSKPFIVDSRFPDGSLSIVGRDLYRIHLPADQLWRIDPTR